MGSIIDKGRERLKKQLARLWTPTDDGELGLALDLTKLVVGFDREHA